MNDQRKSTAIDWLLSAAITIFLCFAVMHCLVFFQPSDGHARQALAKATLQQVGQALDQYRQAYGRYPSTEESLTALTAGERPFLKTLPKDPWGNELQYAFPGTRQLPFDLWIWGPDGTGNAEDDLYLTEFPSANTYKAP